MSSVPNPRFEGSYAGDNSRLRPEDKLECKICWYVYDPALGCDFWQIPAQTAFADLPEHWRCPECDAAKHQFMVLSG